MFSQSISEKTQTKIMKILGITDWYDWQWGGNKTKRAMIYVARCRDAIHSSELKQLLEACEEEGVTFLLSPVMDYEDEWDSGSPETETTEIRFKAPH